MSKTTRAILCASMIFCAASLMAYDPEVHQIITEHAFDAAQINILHRMGLYDHLTIGAPAKSAKAWVAYGSVREDDITESFPPARSVNHFFDPAHGVGLTAGVWPACANSVDILGSHLTMHRADRWAIDYPSDNQWSLGHAREYQYAALVGDDAATRDQAAADMFRAVGHIVHLVQDMAQPEHTRNDQHLAVFGGDVEASLYEAWSKFNLVTIPRGDLVAVMDGYPTVTFPHFADYFANGNGKGLAEFANRNFLTQDTNYDDPSIDDCYTFAIPSILGATPRLEYLGVPVQTPKGLSNIGILEHVFESRVSDLYVGTSTVDGYHTTYSVFDAETQKYDPTRRVYSLNDQSYFSRAAILLPRATAYSAGMMKKFFGNGIDVKWIPLGKSAQNYAIEVANGTDHAIDGGAELTLTYRPGAAYLGQAPKDSVRVLKAQLSALGIPGGIPAHSSRAINSMPVPDLWPGDLINEFTRVAVIRENIGTPDEFFASTVEMARPSSTLELEVQWSAEIPLLERPLIYLFVCETSVDGICTYGFINPAGGDTLEVPTISVTRPDSPTTPYKIKIASTMPGYAYGFYLVTRRESTDVSVIPRRNGLQVLNETRTLSRQAFRGHLLWEVPPEF
jgi:hypothetical protein